MTNYIEKVVQQIQGIENVKVVGVRDTKNKVGEVPKVFITIKRGYEDEASTILQKVQEKCYLELADYYTDGITFECIDTMPLTPLGKIDYRKLKEDSEAKVITLKRK